MNDHRVPGDLLQIRDRFRLGTRVLLGRKRLRQPKLAESCAAAFNERGKFILADRLGASSRNSTDAQEA